MENPTEHILITENPLESIIETHVGETTAGGSTINDPLLRQKHPKPNIANEPTGIPPNTQTEQGSSGASIVPCLCTAHGVCRSTEVRRSYEGRTIRWDAENRCETDAVCTYKKRAKELRERERERGEGRNHRGGNKDGGNERHIRVGTFGRATASRPGTVTEY